MQRRIWLMLALAAAAVAQDPAKKKEPPPPQKKEEPAPLFSGKLGIRSSEKTKESATLGFNGIDPSGKVDQKMLATTASAADEAKVKKLSEQHPNAGELAAFLKEGGLNKK